MESIPNSNNFCGGNFQDWLEVYLEGRCNGKCSFCIDKNGFKPQHHAHWIELAESIIAQNKKNILLLGGEPTLYPDLHALIIFLQQKGKNIYITTNGSKLMDLNFVNKLNLVSCINISIHHWDLMVNKEITGIQLTKSELIKAIEKLHSFGVKVRFNCNCIKGYIDSKSKIMRYIKFAKEVGAASVRFAELKHDDRFIDLAKIFKYQYGLNDNPYALGCHQETIIDGMEISFRQLCGLQCDKRPQIINPKQLLKKVLYYDGKLYDGWQQPKEDKMSSNNDSMQHFKVILSAILKQVESGQLNAKVAEDVLMSTLDSLKFNKPQVIIEREVKIVESEASGGGCVY